MQKLADIAHENDQKIDTGNIELDAILNNKINDSNKTNLLDFMTSITKYLFILCFIIYQHLFFIFINTKKYNKTYKCKEKLYKRKYQQIINANIIPYSR